MKKSGQTDELLRQMHDGREVSNAPFRPLLKRLADEQAAEIVQCEPAQRRVPQPNSQAAGRQSCR